ncbi:MAG: hypothetical protein L0Y44_12280, partial [Phycisphaerales bacterium]|nr:hypothetical protein [Phycisphaerales bacterium]
MTHRQATAEKEAADPAIWLDQHGDNLFAYAIRHVGQVECAEDLVQETLLAAVQQRSTFQSRSSVR